MAYGVVLLPDQQTHDRLAALAGKIGGPGPIHTLGDHAPAHVTVLHFDGSAAQARQIATRAAAHPRRTLTMKIIGLLYAMLAPGDLYVPQGGVYFGIEVVRRPELEALHREALGWVRTAGARTLGAVGDGYRPHVTMGVTPAPSLPSWAEVPTAPFEATLAFGELGPYGTFPGLTPGLR